MSVFKTSSDWCKQGFDELCVSELGDKAERVASNVLVRMLKIHTDTVTASYQYVIPKYYLLSIPDQDHLLLKLSVGFVLRADLIVKVEELLQGLAL